MTPRSLKKMQLVVVVGGQEEFSRVMRCSHAAENHGINIVPIQAVEEVHEALEQVTRILLAFSPQYSLTREQEAVVHHALSYGAHWCSLKVYEGLQHGFAQIHSLHDVLEWIHWSEESLLARSCAKLACLVRRIVAVCLTIFLIPLLFSIALAIKSASPGPVFYRQIRVGHRGKTFALIKFRTMDVSAEASGPQWCQGDGDSRIYPLGRLLRKSHLDELPQLWNIICGDLCFVGPRPERPEFHALLEEHIPHFNVRTRVRPGMTGWAQLRTGYAASPEESRKKVEHDVYFIRAHHPVLIVLIVIRTVQKISKELCKGLFALLIRRRQKAS